MFDFESLALVGLLDFDIRQLSLGRALLPIGSAHQLA